MTVLNRVIMIFIAIFELLCFFVYFVESSPQEANSVEPLLLTPLLKRGLIEEARKRSEVTEFFPNTPSNSGFLTVNDTTNSNLFFWFFRKNTDDWKDAPLVLWLQGGPGCGSLYALFTENGPYRVVKGELRRRRHTWTNEYNVLFVDNPINAGFSFADNYYVSTQEEIGQHLYEALTQFLQLYPELRENRFFITGESYAGKYIPSIAHTIHEKNSVSQLRVNLKGLFIGNGYSDPEHMQGYAEHVHRLGLIDYKTKLRLELREAETRMLIRSGLWKRACNGRVDLLHTLKNITEFQHLWNYLLGEKDEDDSYVQFLQTNRIRERIHVGNVSYADCSDKVYENLREDVPKSVKPWIEQLLEKYPIMLYSGQVDVQVAHFLTSRLIEELEWSGAYGFSSAPRRKWYVDGRLAGYYTQFDNLKYAIIRNAGHMVPTSQPKATLDILGRFINNDL